MQFFLLTVVCGFVGGLGLLTDYLGTGDTRFPGIRGFFSNSGNKLLFSAAAATLGVMKLFFVAEGQSVLIGDLVPAISLMILGISFFLLFNKEAKVVSIPFFTGFLEFLFVQTRLLIGLGALTSSVLHFFFPDILFL